MVDIVFTDIDMPEIDGIELMKRCKKEYPDVKFVVDVYKRQVPSNTLRDAQNLC